MRVSGRRALSGARRRPPGLELAVLVDGAEGARTPGLLDAIQALSQLSYGPKSLKCNAEIVGVSPVDTGTLVVAARRET